MDDLKTYIRAGFPLIQITTAEELRALAEIKRIASIELRSERRPSGYAVWTWSVSTGLVDSGGRSVIYNVRAPKTEEEIKNPTPPRAEHDIALKSRDPVVALSHFMDSNIERHSVVVLFDFHIYLKNPNPMILRLLKDAIKFGRETNRHLIIVGCEVNKPPELDKELISMDLPLPNRKDVNAILNSTLRSAKQTETTERKDEIVRAALGLTSTEASSAMAFSLMKSKKIDPDISSPRSRLIPFAGMESWMSSIPSQHRMELADSRP